MKKLIYVCVLSIGVLAITGCGGGKKLKCEQTLNNSDYGTQIQTYEITFKDEKITKQVVTNKITLSEAMIQYKDDFFASIKSGIDESNTKKGIKSEASMKDTTIETKMAITIKELDTDSKNYAGIDDTQSYDSLKQSFTDNGYTCK